MKTAALHPPVTRALDATAINWELTAVPEPVRDQDDLVVDVLVEAQSYRTLAQQAIHALHDLQQRLDRQQTAYHQTLDELHILTRKDA